MYLLGLSFFYCVAYVVLFFGFPFFFTNSFSKIHRGSIASIVSIFVCYFVVLFLSSSISSPELANRILHTLGGGSLVVLICFLAVKDSGVKIKSFQFFIMSISIAILFGVANEILEYILQNHFGFIFADSVNDTWLDLISNTVGALLASICLIPFIKKDFLNVWKKI